MDEYKFRPYNLSGYNPEVDYDSEEDYEQVWEDIKPSALTLILISVLSQIPFKVSMILQKKDRRY